jgi:hypothetical protein
MNMQNNEHNGKPWKERRKGRKCEEMLTKVCEKH